MVFPARRGAVARSTPPLPPSTFNGLTTRSSRNRRNSDIRIPTFEELQQRRRLAGEFVAHPECLRLFHQALEQEFGEETRKLLVREKRLTRSERKLAQREDTTIAHEANLEWRESVAEREMNQISEEIAIYNSQLFEYDYEYAMNVEWWDPEGEFIGTEVAEEEAESSSDDHEDDDDIDEILRACGTPMTTVETQQKKEDEEVTEATIIAEVKSKMSEDAWTPRYFLVAARSAWETEESVGGDPWAKRCPSPDITLSPFAPVMRIC